jgi:hypothetical protein
MFVAQATVVAVRVAGVFCAVAEVANGNPRPIIFGLAAPFLARSSAASAV